MGLYKVSKEKKIVYILHLLGFFIISENGYWQFVVMELLESKIIYNFDVGWLRINVRISSSDFFLNIIIS